MLPRYKDIAELVKKGATVEAQEKIMELREAALELQEENLELKEKVRALEKALSEKSKLVYEAPFYWKGNGSERDGPFCQQCYDSSEKQIRLQDNGEDYWTCRTCKQGYPGPNYREADLGEIARNLNGDFKGW
ncbi:hypothetical protein [Shewanella algae]|nr:hypothetical protein [Shewanella algae]EKT4489551.1 hypothetical protein [Shewanella algae]MBO2548951.1 hypothetical protein [Shewanella algae]